MKKLIFSAILAAAVVSPVVADAAELREHRSIYISPYLSEWPSGGITASNAERQKEILGRRLDEFKSQNINILYYHVRSMCDATYDSAYEPWSKGVSGKRGKAPTFDPLAYLIEQAHSRGIEIYAWFNPYRYCGVYAHEDTPLNYVNTHPEWLLVQQGKETILNPALEEVQQRIVDVVKDVLVKYDVDGVVFDDYFYSNPTPMSLDAEYYEAAKAADPTVGSQIEWRVANVNRMVERVHTAILETKPWVVFGISPAGTASPPNIQSEYGLEPGPDGDWQYNAIASSPLAWLKAHTIDYISPQIYWPNKFDNLQNWWYKAARKFDRHLYSSISLSSYSTYKGAEYNREAIYQREHQAMNEGGIVFFGYDSFINSSEKIDGVTTKFGTIIGADAFSAPVLTPLRPWQNKYTPATVKNLRREGSRLVWDEVEGMRYTVYAFNAGEELMPHTSNLLQVVYAPNYDIPEELAERTFGVCVYDRYGNEYTLHTEGQEVKAAVAPQHVYPTEGCTALDLFDFEWQAPTGNHVLEVADNAAFDNPIARIPTCETKVNVSQVNDLQAGKQYWWRVLSHGVNTEAAASEASSFTMGRVAVTGPSDRSQSLTPTITWGGASTGSTYHVEVSRNNKFSVIAFEADTDETTVTVPAGKLFTGSIYYVRVTAARDGRTSTSEAATFGTADVIYDAPRFANPVVAGSTLHSNQAVEVEPWDGMSSISLQISTTDGFPTTKTYRRTLNPGENASAVLSEVKISSKYLVDGTTYYVRACGNYFTQDNANTAKTTDWTVTSFVYSAEAGVGDAISDGATCEISADGILSLPVHGCDVAVYTLDGACVLSLPKAPAVNDLSYLAPAFYIIKVTGPVTQAIKWSK